MYTTMAIVFVLGYGAIALEHPLRIDKAASALFTAVVCWVLLIIGRDYILPALGAEGPEIVQERLMHHLGDIGGILFFLLGAMTIVELVDAHGGFSIITDRIRVLQKSRLLIILSVVTFFMSAVLDNLTTAIVMGTLLRKLIGDKHDLPIFGGMIVIAANAGGAWSPIGDVTTIMLWIGGQITAANIVMKLMIPSLVCLLVPVFILSMRLKGKVVPPEHNEDHKFEVAIPDSEKKLILGMGVGALLFVPVFKSLTHLPPFMGILFSLSVLWAFTELLHANKQESDRKVLSIGRILQRVDTSAILFFLGILLAVAALQSAGHLRQLAEFLDQSIGDIWIISVLIGMLSAVVDNVPLVAGAMGMYDLSVYPQDHIFWELLAYCAGTGGSVLIIGSAAGVAIMSTMKIDFIWYMKNISLSAMIGYLAGVMTFWLMNLII